MHAGHTLITGAGLHGQAAGSRASIVLALCGAVRARATLTLSPSHLDCVCDFARKSTGQVHRMRERLGLEAVVPTEPGERR
jgi:hypothetical protein